jgi:hypothetical protein
MNEAQPGTEPTTAGKRGLSRFRWTWVDYGSANGRFPAGRTSGSSDLSELRCSEFCLLVTGVCGGLSAACFDVVDDTF